MLEVDITAIRLARHALEPVTLVETLAFSLDTGASLGVVGESGSGKSLLAFSIMGLLPSEIRAEGRILLDEVDILSLSERKMQTVRGGRVGMVFQEPMTALNPTMRIGDQIAEGLIRHKGLHRSAAAAEALRLLDRVRIPDARRRISAYPHELSGGQRQRVGIAIAIAPGPAILLADEPTTALDVTVQSEILHLLADLVAEMHMSLIIISHDLGVISAVSDRVLVMYAGAAIEQGPTEQVLRRPEHPYTKALLAALPRRTTETGGRLATIPGTVPRPGQWQAGCRFATRCSLTQANCVAFEPGWTTPAPDRAVRCHLVGEPV
jgi:peptide/nickel transport system ATP-binding protein